MSDEEDKHDGTPEEITELRRQVEDLEAANADRVEMEKFLERRVGDLMAINKMTSIVNESSDESDLLDRIMDEVLGLLGIEGVAILLVEAETGDLVTVAHRNVGEGLLQNLGRLRPGQGELGWRAVDSGESVIMGEEDPYFRRLQELQGDDRFKSVASIPLVGRSGALGALHLGAKSTALFDKEGMELLEALGRQIATGIERMRLGEEAFQTIAQYANDAIVIIDRKGKIAYANNKAADATGYELHELVDGDFARVVSPEDLPLAVERFRRRMKGEPMPVEWEFRTLRKDGSTIPVEVVGARIKWRGEEADLAVVRDISERRRAQEEIAKFKTIIEAANSGVAIADLTGKILYANDYFASVHGYKVENILGKDLALLHREDQMEDVRRLIERLLSDGGYSAEEVWHKHRDGYVFPMLMSGVLIKDTEGRASFIAATSIDITQRRHAELALEESEEKFRTLVEGSPDVVVSINRDHEITFVNWAPRGMELSDMLGRSAVEIAFPENRPRLQAALARVFEEGTTISYETNWPPTLEPPDWYAIRLAPLRSEGEVVAAMLVGTRITERKLAEKALRSSEERFRSLVEHSPDFILTVKPDLSITFANRVLSPSVPMEQIIGTKLTDWVPEEDRERVRRLYAEVFEKGESIKYEQIASPPGEPGAYYSTRVAPIKEDGRVTSAVLIASDTTEHRRKDEALQESEQKFRSLVESIPDFILTVNRDLKITFLNATRPDRDINKILGADVREWPTPEFADTVIGSIEHVLDTGEPVSLEAVRGDIYDEPRWYSARLVPLRQEGKVTDVLVVSRDITALVEASNALKESEEKLRSLVEHSPDIILTVDSQLQITFINRVYPGFHVDQVLGTDFAKWLHAEDKVAVERAMRQIFSGGTSASFEVKVDRPGHEPGWFAVRGGPISRDGRVVSAIVVATEISVQKTVEEERRRLEAQLQQAKMMESMGTMAGGIAHYFNNVLSGVLGGADLALLELPAESPARGYLEMIKKISRNLAELTRKMLDYSGRGSRKTEEIDLSAITRELIPLLEVSIPKNVSVSWNLSSEPVRVLGDVAQMGQIVVSLVTNAGEAIGEKAGSVEVTTGTCKVDREYLTGVLLDDGLPEGRYAYLRVTDTGCGMDEDRIKRVFDLFYTTKFPGRGLGLAATLGVVRAHRGTIKVDSVPGEGSTFTMLLPLATGEWKKPPTREISLESWTGRGRVLVVDDEEVVRVVARGMLERAGFTVLTATDGEDALRLFRERGDEVDVVVLNLTMRVLGGEGTLREIRRLNPAIPIILSSGYGEEEANQRLGKHEVQGFIQKPYDTETLLATLREVLAP